MRYLSKDERREEILQAAMHVALTEGFAAMTVRRIATEAASPPGRCIITLRRRASLSRWRLSG